MSINQVEGCQGYLTLAEDARTPCSLHSRRNGLHLGLVAMVALKMGVTAFITLCLNKSCQSLLP